MWTPGHSLSHGWMTLKCADQNAETKSEPRIPWLQNPSCCLDVAPHVLGGWRDMSQIWVYLVSVWIWYPLSIILENSREITQISGHGERKLCFLNFPWRYYYPTNLWKRLYFCSPQTKEIILWRSRLSKQWIIGVTYKSIDEGLLMGAWVFPRQLITEKPTSAWSNTHESCILEVPSERAG